MILSVGEQVEYIVMEILSKSEIAYYEEITPINEEHGVFLVHHSETGKTGVKKVMERYDLEVYLKVKKARIEGIPRIYAMEEDEGKLTLIEEYIEGENLESIINKKGALADEDISHITMELCDILIKLHSLSPPVIHRDIKPSNIMITPEGKVYLIDLNAAKIENTLKEEDTTLLGTYGYAAPEQFGFGSSRIQTDIYATGMLINTMLYGEYSKEIKKDSCFTEIIRKCLMLNPEDRYLTATDLKKALKDPVKGGKPKEFLPPGFRSGNPVHMIVAAIIYAVIASLCIGLETKNQTTLLIKWYERAGSLSCLILLIFFMGDYRHIQDRFLLCRNRNIWIRLAAVLIWTFVLGVLLFILLISGELFIKSF